MTADWVAAPAQWFPTSWDVNVAGSDKTIPIKTAFPLYASVGTSNGQIAE